MTTCHVAAVPSSNHYVQVRGGSGDVTDGQSRGDTWRGGWQLMTRYKVAGQSQLDTCTRYYEVAAVKTRDPRGNVQDKMIG
ncbi:hypothetical protein Tco_0999329 [Tanacetum coccineum]